MTPEAPPLTDAQILGLVPTGQGILPSIPVNLPILELARAVVANLPYGSLYRLNDRYVTIAEETRDDGRGDTSTTVVPRTMTANRMSSWIEQHVSFKNGNGERVSISKNTAERILESDILLERTPVVREIVPVRLPVWGVDANGRKALDLAPVGYDPTTGIYTADTIPYPYSKPWSPEAVVASLKSLLHLFPWGDEGSFTQNRSVAAFITFMLGQYLRHVAGKQPLILFSGNQPGTGKTLLAAIGLAPVYGEPEITPYPKDDAELRKVLLSKLMYGSQYVLIDDLTSLTSATINQYATSGRITDRPLGGNDIFTGENRMQIIGTGNDLYTTPDVERRALIVDLFCAEAATERAIKNPLTLRTLNGASWRADLLRALWSLAKAWSDAGAPEHIPPSAKPSFEEYASVVGSIVVHAGFTNPFAKRENNGTGGDTAGAALERLMKELAATVLPADGGEHTNTTCPFTVGEILEAAKERGIDNIICNGRDYNRSMGHKLKKIKGRVFTDPLGRKFSVGRHRDAVTSVYPIVILSEPTPKNNNKHKP